MIKSALVAMTILGCNCEQNTCEYIRTAGVPSLSMTECQQRMKTEIEHTNAEYPLVVAVCENLPERQPAGLASSANGIAADGRARASIHRRPNSPAARSWCAPASASRRSRPRPATGSATPRSS